LIKRKTQKYHLKPVIIRLISKNIVFAQVYIM